MSFLLQVTPNCDCKTYSNAPICPDIGILASYDPVALDQAGLDLINAAVQQGKPSMEATNGDVFSDLYPKTNGRAILELAQKMGLGSRKYSLQTVQ